MLACRRGLLVGCMLGVRGIGIVSFYEQGLCIAYTVERNMY